MVISGISKKSFILYENVIIETMNFEMNRNLLFHGPVRGHYEMNINPSLLFVLSFQVFKPD